MNISTRNSTASRCTMSAPNDWHEWVEPSTVRILSLTTVIVDAASCPFTILLNGLVILSLLRNRSLRSNPNIIIGCLAVTDLLAGLTQPLYVAKEVIRLQGAGPSCAVENTLYASVRVLVLCSLLHVVLMNIDRLIAMKFTMRYQVLITAELLIKVSLTFWIISITVFIPWPFCYKIDCWYFVVWFQYAWPIISTSCITICIYSCLIVASTARRHRRQILADYKRNAMPMNTIPKSNASFLFITITGLLVLSYGALTLLKSLEQRFPKDKVLVFQPLVEIFLVHNSLFNPILYSIRKREFRQAFKNIIRHRNRATNDIHRLVYREA